VHKEVGALLELVCKQEGCGPTIVYQHIGRVDQKHTFIGIYSVHTVFLAGKSPYIQSYMVQIYGSGQP